MANPPLAEKLTYQTLKEVFTGDANAIPPSTLKTIRKRIERFRNAKIGALIERHGLEEVTRVAKVLLDDQVFQSTAKAKLRFPDLFQTLLPSHNEELIPTGPKAMASSTVAVQRGGAHSPEQLLSIRDNIATGQTEQKSETDSVDQSLDSVLLPLWDQHRLLVRTQYTLEKACFSFAERELGGLLQREGWDCAEAVELNQWARTLSNNREVLHLADANDSGKPLTTILDWITQLRHDAVHRVRLSSSNLLQRMTAAVLLARLLQDDECGKVVSHIRQKTQTAIEEMVRNKQSLDTKLAQIKEEFAAKKAELERQENALLEAAVKEHKKPVTSVSRILDQWSDGFGDTAAIHAFWKHESDSAPLDHESPGSESTTETDIATSATEPTAQKAIAKTQDPAGQEGKKAREVDKSAKNDNKDAEEQVNQREEADEEAAEEEEGIEESKVSGKPGDDAVEDLDEDVELVKQLSEPPIPVTTVDYGLIKSAFADGAEDDWKDKDDDSLERYFECPEVVLDSCESSPKYPSYDPALEQQVVATDTTSEERTMLDAAVASESSDSDLLGHDQGSIHERFTSSAPTCVGQTDSNTEKGHTKSLVEEDISAGDGAMDLEASPEQPNATRGHSNVVTVIKSWGEGQWPGSVCIKSLDDDPRLTSLPTANEKGRVALVSMLEDIETAV